jgi:hypothetical protein
MTDSDEFYIGMEIGDDPSSAVGIETLADQDLIKMTSLEIHNPIN